MPGRVSGSTRLSKTYPPHQRRTMSPTRRTVAPGTPCLQRKQQPSPKGSRPPERRKTFPNLKPRENGSSAFDHCSIGSKAGNLAGSTRRPSKKFSARSKNELRSSLITAAQRSRLAKVAPLLMDHFGVGTADLHVIAVLRLAQTVSGDLVRGYPTHAEARSAARLANALSASKDTVFKRVVIPNDHPEAPWRVTFASRAKPTIALVGASKGGAK